MRESEESQVIDVVNAAYGKRRLTQDHFDRWRREDPLFNEDWILVAISDGKMVGVLCLRQDLQYSRVLRRRRGYVGPAATLPQYRSRGIGKALNWHGMKFLKAQGLNEASLYTAENNLPVHRMVSALGYERRYTWKRFKKTLRSSRIPEAIQ
jgi:ribosomal protein S18 acetylase RimI-like enzyme